MPTEKDFQHEVNRIGNSAGLQALIDEFGPNCAVELKCVKKKSVSFAGKKPDIRLHQPRCLLAATKEGQYVRIEDQTLGKSGHGSTSKKPFDCLWLSGSSAWFGFWVYVPNQRKEKREVLWVRVGDWLELEAEAESRGSKSVKVSAIRKVGRNFNVWIT